MFNYAQVNSEDIVVTVASLSGESNSTDMISIDIYDTSLLGKKYNREINQFEEVINAN